MGRVEEREVLKSVHDFLEAHRISDGENDADDLIDGRPIDWVLNRARAFGTNFRDHRKPTHPTGEQIAAVDSKTLRKTMQTYGQRLVRANAPPEMQKKADWRNFVARTSRTVDMLISNAQVHFFLWPRLTPNYYHFTLIPTPTRPNTPLLRGG